MVMGDMEMSVELVVIGAGPAGYSAAFRAAERGLDVALVDPFPTPGGNYLYNSSVPRLAFYTLSQNKQLQFSEIKEQTKTTINQIGSGLATRASQTGVLYVQGSAHFESSSTVRIADSDINKLRFEQAIIATGSKPVALAFENLLHDNKGRFLDNKSALVPDNLPENLVILGASPTGLELATIYSRLGSNVEVLEPKGRLLPQLDLDFSEKYLNQLTTRNLTLYLGAEIDKLIENKEKIECNFKQGGNLINKSYDLAISASERTACSDELGLHNTQVLIDEMGSIQVNDSMHTDDPKIFAAGSVTGGLNHINISRQQGRIAADNACESNSVFDVQAIPNVIFTEPQLAWCGMNQAQAASIPVGVEVRSHPWNGSHRACIENSINGITKLIADKASGRILGAQILGNGAEHLIAQIALAIEMGSLLEDLSLCLKPGLTLSDTITETANAIL